MGTDLEYTEYVEAIFGTQLYIQKQQCLLLIDNMSLSAFSIAWHAGDRLQ